MVTPIQGWVPGCVPSWSRFGSGIGPEVILRVNPGMVPRLGLRDVGHQLVVVVMPVPA